MSKDVMTIDGYSFETLTNGCVWVNGTTIFAYWQANASEKDAVLEAQSKYRNATRANRESEQATKKSQYSASLDAMSEARMERMTRENNDAL